MAAATKPVGELVQWDASEHHWLEGTGGSERLYLIAMIDDATSRLFARFVRSDSTEENMRLLWSYLEKFGRPLTFYTDKAALFRPRRQRSGSGMNREWRRTQWRCRRRRARGPYKSWVSGASRVQAAKPAKKSRKGARGSDWNKDFDLKKAPEVWQAAQASGYRKDQPL